MITNMKICSITIILLKYRYSGEYTDSESGLIYLRARMYDPQTGRFINEDPVKDGENWYVYAGNNPILFIDPFGLYYVVENKTRCSCMDPRCHNFGNSTGTYRVYADNWFTSIARTITGEFVVGGGLINLSIESALGVSGGNSKTPIGDVGKDMVAGAFANTKNQRFNSIFKKIGWIYTIKSIVDNADIVMMDKISFELLQRNNISRDFSSVKKAEQTMEKMYSFISSNNYYFSSRPDGSNTLFEIDESIAKSKNPQKTIDWFAYSYKSALMRNIGVPMNYAKAEAQYKGLLGNYKERRELVDAFVGGVR